VVEDLIEYGMVQRGYLGLLIRSVDGNLAKEKDLEVIEGVYVDSITATSAAGEAGIKEGDVILSVNDKRTRTSSNLLEIVGSQRPGDEVSLEVDRFGKKLDFAVVLKNQDGEVKFMEKTAESVLDILGMELEELDPNLAKKLDIEEGLKVSKLRSGKLKRSTDMRDGFIITKVDGKKPGSVEEFTRYLNQAKGGVMLEGVYEDIPGTYYYAFGM
jgi:S1-C subfamily serine protease